MYFSIYTGYAHRMKMSRSSLSLAARQPFLLEFTKWVCVFHNAILKCTKTVFAGISHGSILLF